MHRYLLAVVALAVLAGCGEETPNAPAPVAATPVPTPTPTPTPTATPLPSASGFWHSEARAWDIELVQQGGTLRGQLLGFKNVTFAPEPALQITGTVDAAGTVEFHADAYALRFSGTLEPGGARMTGQLFDCVQVCRNYGEILIRR